MAGQMKSGIPFLRLDGLSNRQYSRCSVGYIPLVEPYSGFQVLEPNMIGCKVREMLGMQG